MTYLPPVNGGRINATISGNTAGAGALVSSGTLSLAGGNNITLSQNGNAITISGANAGGAGSHTLGMSNLGNTGGTTGVISGSALQFAFAGGNNVTLSQSLNASSGTLTISAANQTVQTQNLHNITLAGNSTSAGAGYIQVSSGTLTLAGGNNITLSQNGNAVTISGVAVGSHTLGISNLGNATGTTGVISGSALQYALAGGNNITLSQSLNGSSGTVTISAASQSAQTQSNIQALYDGTNSISTGTIRLSNANGVSFGLNGQTLTASVNAGAGGGIAAIANTDTTYSSGTVHLVTDSGAITIGSSTNGASQSYKFAVPATSSLVASGAITISTNGSTINIGAPPADTLSHWIHNSAGLYNSTTSNMANASLSIVRMLIPESLSFSRVEVPVSISGATSATANTAAMAISAVGVLYSRSGSTLNPIVGHSSTGTYSYASNSGVYSSVTGPRLVSFNLATTLSAGEYFMGFQMSSATSSVGTATTNLGWTVAPVFGSSNTAAPWMNLSAATNATINLLQPLQGVNATLVTNTTQTHQQSQISHSGGGGARANIVVVFRNN